MKTEMDDLIGHEIREVFWGEDRVIFMTDYHAIAYQVDGDCCSHSYLYDFYGVRNLLDNGPVTAVEVVNLEPLEKGGCCTQCYGYRGCYTQCYGYRLITVHPVWGEQSAVFSFRNESNGYYGGSIRRSSYDSTRDLRSLTDDVIGS